MMNQLGIAMVRTICPKLSSDEALSLAIEYFDNIFLQVKIGTLKRTIIKQPAQEHPFRGVLKIRFFVKSRQNSWRILVKELIF